MENLKSELSLVLGEPVSSLETISEQPPTRLYALYDRDGKPMPLVAKYFRHQGRAALEAKKLALLGHEGLIAVPAVYGLVLSQPPPVHEMLLMARLNGVSAEAPTRDAARWQQRCEEVVEGLLAWHRISSHGLVGTVEITQQNSWPAWFHQRVEVLWSTLSYLQPPSFTLADRQVLFRSREKLADFFRDVDDPCVMVHGNVRLYSMIKNARSDQLLAMTQLGTILWAPREY